MLWQEASGIGALASISNTFEYAPDNLNFMSHKLGLTVENRPKAPGVFREDLTQTNVGGEGLKWEISMAPNGAKTYLNGYKLVSK